MKKVALAIFTAAIFVACKQQKKETQSTEGEVIHDTVEVTTIDYSKESFKPIASILRAHGGMEQWNKMNNLCFEIKEGDAREVHTTSLKDRKSRIETIGWVIGRDDKNVWLQQKKEDAYDVSRARFYHNLMFYFYAMPFILADDGIIYREMETVEFDGKLLNATEISYHDGVGDSPKDQYIIYSDPKTNKMEWLGYTVTYGKTEQSTDFHFIKYSEWQEINDLLLPKTLSWYTSENNIPTEKRSDLTFEKVTVTETVLENEVFAMPEGAEVAPK